jgi:M-phase inducer tyrosine phosphatase
MDISPLPHKQPCFVAHITLPSPSPEPTEHDDNDMLSCQEALSLPTPEKPTLMPLPERKKSAFLRPSLARSKGHSYSTTSVPQQEHKLPTFKFGGSGLSCTSSPSSECESSPSKSYMIPPSRRTSLCRNNGSPLGSQVRKSAAVRPPPRKQVRRSLSMFQHPDDVINGQQDDYSHINSSPSVSMDLDEPYKPKLPHFINEEEPDSLPRVKQDTLVSVLNGDYNSHYDKILIVDCRFEYEYNGGHINGAVNYNDKDQLTKDLFEHGGVTPNTLLILHCEYSELRAPRMAKFVRNRDRAVNDFQYPKLTFPEMYILEGGYSKFFASHRTKCFPQNYVEMHHKDHEQECEKGMGKLKQRAKLNRAQTYAFGQCHEDSPTSGNRMGSRSLSTIGIFDASPDNSPLSQNLVRRLASY